MDEKKVLEDTGCIIVSDEPMSAHTTFHTGGTARFFAVPESGERLLTVKMCAEAYDIPYYILGGGANVLFPDEGFNGVVISTAGIDSLYLDDAGRLHGGCGASVNSAVKFACDHGLAGLEFFYAMPGSLGGAVYMNARCYGQSISDVLAETYYLDRAGKYACLRTSSSDFDYKISPFQKNGGIILEAVFSLETGNSEIIKIEMEKYRKDRISKGHFEYPCAGSVFKNDRNFGEPTGKIIDSLGLRGYSIGGAKVSEHHANIIVNAGNATAADIKALVSYVADRVHEAYSYTLEREIIYVDPEGGNDNT